MKKNSKKIMKWINIVAFAILLVGGLNFLLMGLFQFDVFAAIFGGGDEVVTRIIYSLFGVAALVLIGFILWKALMSGEKKSAPKTASSS